MRISVAFNLRMDSSEETAELLTQEDVERISTALRELRHQVTPVEVTGQPDEVVGRLLDSAPDLIFNCAEGTIGSSREAFYPGLYEQLRIPFTGGNPSLLHMNLDKKLAKTVVAARGVRVPRGVLVTPQNRKVPADLKFPHIIKPNAERSSKGITQDSVVESRQACDRRLEELLKRYPAGLVVEEFIAGRELSIPIVEALPGKIVEIVEHTFDLDEIGGAYNIYDYDMKQGGDRSRGVGVVCPALLAGTEARLGRSYTAQEQAGGNLAGHRARTRNPRRTPRTRAEQCHHRREGRSRRSLHPEGRLCGGSRHQRVDHSSDRGFSDRTGRRRHFSAQSCSRRICAQRGW